RGPGCGAVCDWHRWAAPLPSSLAQFLASSLARLASLSPVSLPWAVAVAVAVPVGSSRRRGAQGGASSPRVCGLVWRAGRAWVRWCAARLVNAVGTAGAGAHAFVGGGSAALRSWRASRLSSLCPWAPPQYLQLPAGCAVTIHPALSPKGRLDTFFSSMS